MRSQKANSRTHTHTHAAQCCLCPVCMRHKGRTVWFEAGCSLGEQGIGPGPGARSRLVASWPGTLCFVRGRMARRCMPTWQSPGPAHRHASTESTSPGPGSAAPANLAMLNLTVAGVFLFPALQWHVFYESLQCVNKLCSLPDRATSHPASPSGRSSWPLRRAPRTTQLSRSRM